MIHLLAANSFGTVHATVPLRTFISTITVACTTNFDIYTAAAISPTSRTPGSAVQPDSPLDEAGCNKQAGGYRKYFHVGVVNLQLELT